MELAETYKRVRPGIVAFAPLDSEGIRAGASPFASVFGTGFIIDDSLIATNAHVIDVFKNYQHDTDGKVDVVALAFVRTHAGLTTVLLSVVNACYIKSIHPSGFYYGPLSPDLGLVAVNCTGLSKLALTLEPNSVPEGTAIATAGFPMGSDLLHIEGQLAHISPTLQSGIVSATLPFPDANPHGYLINVMVHGGASGSPVFLAENGNVIGAVYASHHDNSIPTTLTHVVPSSFLHQILDANKSELIKSLTSDAPSLDEIVASVPSEPVQQITAGVYRKSMKQDSA